MGTMTAPGPVPGGSPHRAGQKESEPVAVGAAPAQMHCQGDGVVSSRQCSGPQGGRAMPIACPRGNARQAVGAAPRPRQGKGAVRALAWRSGRSGGSQRHVRRWLAAVCRAGITGGIGEGGRS